MMLVMLAACSGGGGGGGGSNANTIKAAGVTVTAVNDAYTVGQAKSLSVAAAAGVLANDTTSSGSLTASLVTGPVHGTLSLNADGSFTYVHDGVGGAPDSFIYRTTSGPSSATATVTITIAPTVTAVNDAYTVGQAKSLSVAAAAGVLANDTTSSGSLTASLVTGPVHGTLSLNADGSFTYVHDGVGGAPDSFIYRTTSGPSSATATVTITIAPTVTAVNDAYTVGQAKSLSVAAAAGVLANDTTSSGSLTASLVTGPVHGTLSLNADGSFTYVHDGVGGAPDSFIYRTTSGPSSATATVTITIAPRILVLAPHPDDDIITAAGVTSNAISHGQSVKVVYMTNGDNYGLSSGYTREGEAVTAQTEYLGTTEDDLIFLGYPDAHLQEVYTNYPNSGDSYTTSFGQSVTYGNRGLGRKDYHSYRFGSPALYNRYNIVLDLEEVISTYRPQHIYTTSEFDTHPDHSTTYQLLKLALAGVHSIDPTYTPVIHKTIVWVEFPNTNSWPPPSDPTSYFPTVQATHAGSNIAALAAVTASSENTSTSQQAIKAVDGVIDGYPGDYTREWATVGQGVGAWLKLVWGSAYTVNQVVLYDRPNSTEQITSATLSFSDGSSVAVGALNNNGAAVTVNFSARTVTSLTLTVNGVSGGTSNIGLAEIQVYGSPAGGGNLPPTANAGPDKSANEGTAVTLSGSGSDSDGTIAAYTWTQTAGPSVILSGAATATAGFTAPAVTANTVLTFQLTVTDNLGATGTDTVNVEVPGLSQTSLTWDARESLDVPLAMQSTNYSINPKAGAIAAHASQGGLNGFIGRFLRKDEFFWPENLNGSNQPPRAAAGFDFTAIQGTTAQLNGTGSFDPEGASLTYSWTQTAGPAVVLGNATSATPTFTAPTVSSCHGAELPTGGQRRRTAQRPRSGECHGAVNHQAVVRSGHGCRLLAESQHRAAGG